MTLDASDRVLRQFDGGNFPFPQGSAKFGRRAETPLRFCHIFLPVFASRGYWLSARRAR
jgi:hypothetical protein